MDSRTIRKKFLEFFAERGHEVVRSASIVPANDPTLYFTNAGMVQFKDVFVGLETRPYSRACSSQKCLRVSGKHNDLETVGRTPKHHTFFEMLGNFSFGDYFKTEAIRYAWEFLTEVIGLPADRMIATVFGGEEGVPADEDAERVWRHDVGLPAERVMRLGMKDNFWAMGDQGPCGPCSELHLMSDPNVSMEEALAAGGPEVDDRWVEVWNLVFMQFNRQADGTLEPLKRTGVDTGMGLERLTALVNGMTSTYDTDVMRPLIEHGAKLSGHRYGENADVDTSLRVMADHARATAFCVADGVFPEKGGREYVLRRVMRRAIRHAKLLGVDDVIFDQLCLKVTELMGPDYPELVERAAVISKVAHAEETAFRRTLDRGLNKLQQAVARAKADQADHLPDAFVGDLYATDGFPVDLTGLIAAESGLAVDEAAALRWVAKTHGSGDSKVGEQAVAAVYKRLAETCGPTVFVGYEQQQGEGAVCAFVREGETVQQASEGKTVEVIVERTPFYGRSGGQVGDIGTISGPDGQVEVTDTTKPDGTLIVHHGKVVAGTIKQGQSVQLVVDDAQRQAIRLNHSATHLLHHALRAVLGDHVAQKGSEVSAKQLRFDFSHFEAMTPDELQEVERLVNAEIRANAGTETEIADYENARKSGAIALFGEKYGDKVRVVHIGRESIELCGGTHVVRTGDIGLFRIVSEESLALGVRRIMAVTGEAALLRDQDVEQRLKQAARALKATPETLAERIDKLQEQLKQKEREASDMRRQLASGGNAATTLDKLQEIDGVKVLAVRTASGEPKALREAGDALRDRVGSGVIVIAAEHEGTARLLVMVSKDLTKRVHAGKLVGQLAQTIGGRGGGRPDMAQAGGPLVDHLDDALAQVPELVRRANV